MAACGDTARSFRASGRVGELSKTSIGLAELRSVVVRTGGNVSNDTAGAEPNC
jgi:hypothetical protein